MNLKLYSFLLNIKFLLYVILLSLLIFRCNKKDVVSYVQEVYEPDKGMIYIPAGEFTMGSNDGNADESPDHSVFLDAYYIDENPVTNAQYAEFLNSINRYNSSVHTPKDFGEETWEFRLQVIPRHPVVGISYESAFSYAFWAGKELPTEAQWEKAAKGETMKKYPWGDIPPYNNGKYRANYQTLYFGEDGFHKTSPVGFYNGKNLYTESGRSPYELNDMAGNVWEWVQDWYSPTYYRQSQYANPTGPEELYSEKTRVIRGGSWKKKYNEVYTTTRNSIQVRVKEEDLGFRCVRNVEENPSP